MILIASCVVREIIFLLCWLKRLPHRAGKWFKKLGFGFEKLKNVKSPNLSYFNVFVSRPYYLYRSRLCCAVVSQAYSQKVELGWAL